jgi:hypothetical protein
MHEASGGRCLGHPAQVRSIGADNIARVLLRSPQKRVPRPVGEAQPLRLGRLLEQLATLVLDSDSDSAQHGQIVADVQRVGCKSAEGNDVRSQG